MSLKKKKNMDWAPDCEAKGHQFKSQSGHMPGWQARSQVGGTWGATTHWCFSPALSLSLPLSLKINKIFKNMFIDFREETQEGRREISLGERNMDYLPPICSPTNPRSNLQPSNLVCALRGNRTPSFLVYRKTVWPNGPRLPGPDVFGARSH